MKNLTPQSSAAFLSVAVFALLFAAPDVRAESCVAYDSMLLQSDLVLDNSTECSVVSGPYTQFSYQSNYDYLCSQQEIPLSNCVLIGLTCPTTGTEFLVYFVEDSTRICWGNTNPPPTTPPAITSCSAGSQTDASGQTCGTIATSVDGTSSNGPGGPGAGAGSGPGGGTGCRGGCCGTPGTAAGGSGGNSTSGSGGGVAGGGSQQTMGDPCNVSNGANWHVDQVVSIPGRTKETALTFTRTYVANAAAPAGDLGPNWRHNWESALFSASDGTGNLIWIDDFGGPWTFFVQPDGSFQSPPGQFAILTSLSDHYELRFTNGVKYLFSNGTATGAPPAGRLTGITDAHGESVNLAYDSSGTLLSISNLLGGTLTLGRDSSGHIISITRSVDGLRYSFTYTADGKLASETDIAGRTTQYSYNTTQPGTYAQGMLASITDPLGRINAFTYYDDGRIFDQLEPGTGVRTFVYSGMQSAPVTTVTDVDLQTSVFKFNSNLDLIESDLPDGSVRTLSWNSLGVMGSQTDELGHTTQYGYDSNGNITQIARADGSVTQIKYDPTWNKPISLIPPTGAVSTWTLNPATGDVLSFTKTDPATQNSLSLTYTVDSFGGVLSTNNGLTSYSNQRDSSGRLTYVFDLHNPQILKYDALSRLIERDYQSGRVLTYVYDTLDRLIRIDDTNGPSTLNTYDLVGRLTSQTLTDGKTLQTTAFQFDDRDRITQITDPLGHLTQMSYDIQTANGLVILPEPVSVTDPNGNVTRSTFDNRDRLVTRTDPRGAVTAYTYDSHGNLISLADPDQNKSTFTYDVDNRLIEQDRPSVITDSKGHTTATIDKTVYQYDSIDELIEKTESSPTGVNSALTALHYDAYGRLTEKKLEYVSNKDPSKIQLVDDSTFTYSPEIDATLMTTANNETEALSFTSENAPPFAGTSFGVQATDPKNALQLLQDRFTVTRDVTGNIASISNLENKTLLTETYDPAGRLTKAVAAQGFFTPHGTGLQAAIAYDSFGRKSGATFSDGLSETILYDQASQIKDIRWMKGKELFMSEALLYDATGNIIEQDRESSHRQYGYDSTNQLTSAKSKAVNDRDDYLPYNQEFQYDLAGNRVRDNVLGTSTILSNAVIKDDMGAIGYDANGFGAISKINSQRDLIREFAYRPDGKLLQVSNLGSFGSNGKSVQYKFDALGRRVAKADPTSRDDEKDDHLGVQSYTYLMNQDRILFAKGSDGQQSLQLDGQAIDEHLGFVSKNETHAYVTDHLGSVLSSGASERVTEYGAFGEISSYSAETSKSKSPIEYGFAGYPFDPESGLYCTGARCYDPSLGRWLSTDPIGIDGGDSNFYRYVFNQPSRSVDPSGLFRLPPWIPPWLPAVVAGAAIVGSQKACVDNHIAQTIQQTLHDELPTIFPDPNAPQNSSSVNGFGDFSNASIN